MAQDQRVTVRRLRRGDGPVLLCLPFSGGASYSFSPLARLLGGGTEVVSVDPPGHGTNRERPVRDLERMVDLYEEAAGAFVGRPLVVFGHSLGGLAAFRLTQRLERAARPPRAVVISGTAAPGEPSRVARSWLAMDDEELLADVRRLGVTSDDVLADAGFRTRVLQTLRADAEVVLSFADPAPAPLATFTHLFAGRDDADAPPESVAAWGTLLTRSRLQVFEGPHMFPLLRAPEVAAALQAILDEAGEQPAVRR